ncbi:hypothetical protein O181_124176 [Austropuccinia psidii MF-1]|uniref:Uncharacterized protein n=1 Tax=Austropuccinia psidii MF-1 TaxID=1389203 RepID=A0A9Q3KPX6_9BASI|nr:hypothetical protein [Austropuccinia psidii MF-1]
MVPSLLHRSELIIRRWQEDIQAWANHHHVLSPAGFKCQKQNPRNPPQQDSPIPRMPSEQTPQQPTPRPSGTQWSEDLSRGRQPTFPFLILTDSSSFCRTPKHNEPPIPGPGPSSKPSEDVLTPEPEPEVAPRQSMEEPFDKSSLLFLYSYLLFLTPPLTISSSSHYSPLHNHHQQYVPWIPPPPLFPTMTLARNLPTYN